MANEDRHQLCPGCGRELRRFVRGACYSSATLIEVWGQYDGGLFFADTKHSGGCGFAWHRWPKGHHLRQRAEKYVQEWNRNIEDLTLQGDDTPV